MATGNNLSLVLLMVASVALPACVTINIYFPAAAAEQAVDKIIEEVWQADEKAGEGSESDSKNGKDKP